MSFINPLFILGALAASIPVLLHLVRREHAKKIEFSTLMFLRKISKKTIRYQKLRHLLLLILRVLALILIVLAFMRPYREINQSAAVAQRKSSTHVILLDNSMSMHFQGRWEKAKAEASNILRKMNAGDKCLVLEFSDQVVARTQLSDDRAEALAQIEHGIELSDRATRYGPALTAAAKTASESGTARRIIYLISDFQKNGYGAEERELHLADGIELQPMDVGSDDFSNLAIRDARLVEAGGERGNELLLKSSVISFGSQDRQNVKAILFADDRKMSETRIDITHGDSRPLEFGLPRFASGSHSIVIEIEDASLTPDNRFYLTLDAREKTPVVAVEASARQGRRAPSYFLAKALNVDALSPYRLTPTFLQNPDVSGGLLIWNNVSGGDGATQERLRKFVAAGGGLVVVLGDAVQPAEFNRSFGSWLPLKMKASGVEDQTGRNRPSEQYRLMTDIRMDHPIFLPFSKPHSGSFSSAKFFYHAGISAGSGAEVVAAFDNGDPALIAVNYEKGRVLIFASSADDASNDLPLKAVYAPFWQQMLRYLENFRELRHWHDVGDIINARELLRETALRQSKRNPDRDETIAIIDPGKNRMDLSDEAGFAAMDRAGFYEIRTMSLNTTIAANIVSRESDLTHGNAEEMISGWISSKPGAVSQEERLTPEEVDRAQHFWFFLLAGGSLLLAAESLLSNHRFADDDLKLRGELNQPV